MIGPSIYSKSADGYLAINTGYPMQSPFYKSQNLTITVVICTYNRGFIIESCIRALLQQTYRNFEIVVVNGPSTDNTSSILEIYKDVRVIHTAARNLSQSRNLGIETAKGEIIAFIDDDSIATPTWLQEIANGYVNDRIGGVGGFVYDHTGTRYQYRYSACYRNGKTAFSENKFPPHVSEAGANPFIYIQGTNASFRREALVQIGGFNEQIEYYHDETDVCCRIIDGGYKIIAIDGAAVHHKYAKSATRDDKRIVKDPYVIVKNHHQFALQNGESAYPKTDLMASLFDYTEEVHSSGRWYFRNQELTRVEAEYFVKQVNRGVIDGLKQGNGPRPFRKFNTSELSKFIPYGIARSRRGHICFISSEYPPSNFGGIGRYTHDLATSFAKMGFLVHVITRSSNLETVDFENGVWIHRIKAEPAGALALVGPPLIHNLALITRVYEEVLSIHSQYHIDIINSPIWLCEGLLCSIDPRFTSILTLMTTLKTIRDMHSSWHNSAEIDNMIKLERETKLEHTYIHAISNSILSKVDNDYGKSSHSAVIPLGAQRPQGNNVEKIAGDRVKILFVGRLERRKGIDLLLTACINMLKDGLKIELQLVGADTENTELDGKTYKSDFRDKFSESFEIVDHVNFIGTVNDTELSAYYHQADVLCLPSRFESFGLVLVEAMAHGTPVVAANTGGMAEIVQEGVNGLLFEAESAASLEAKLRLIVGNPTLRSNLGQNSKKLFDEKYDADSVAFQAAEVFDNWSSKNGKTLELSPYDAWIMVNRLSSVMQKVFAVEEPVSKIFAISMLQKSILYDCGIWLPAIFKIFRDEREFLNVVGIIYERSNKHYTSNEASNILDKCGGKTLYVVNLFSSMHALLEKSSLTMPADWQIWRSASLAEGTLNEKSEARIHSIYAQYYNETIFLSDDDFIKYLYRLALAREPELPYSELRRQMIQSGGRICYIKNVVQSLESVSLGISTGFDAELFQADLDTTVDYRDALLRRIFIQLRNMDLPLFVFATYRMLLGREPEWDMKEVLKRLGKAKGRGAYFSSVAGSEEANQRGLSFSNGCLTSLRLEH